MIAAPGTNWNVTEVSIGPWVWRSSGQTSVPLKLITHTLFLSTFNKHVKSLSLRRWLSRFMSATRAPMSYCHHLHIPWIAYSSLLFARQRFQDPHLFFKDSWISRFIQVQFKHRGSRTNWKCGYLKSFSTGRAVTCQKTARWQHYSRKERAERKSS